MSYPYYNIGEHLAQWQGLNYIINGDGTFEYDKEALIKKIKTECQERMAQLENPVCD